jgi:uncharacterized protein YjbJ (UPF0337 family)
MNNAQVEGSWNQLKGEAKRVWGDLTDDDFTRAEGSSEKLIGIIQERFGDARESIRNALRRWI